MRYLGDATVESAEMRIRSGWIGWPKRHKTTQISAHTPPGQPSIVRGFLYVPYIPYAKEKAIENAEGRTFAPLAGETTQNDTKEVVTKPLFVEVVTNRMIRQCDCEMRFSAAGLQISQRSHSRSCRSSIPTPIITEAILHTLFLNPLK